MAANWKDLHAGHRAQEKAGTREREFPGRGADGAAGRSGRRRGSRVVRARVRLRRQRALTMRIE